MASASNRDFAFHDKRRDTEHEGFLAHRRMRWLKIAVMLCIAAFAGYFLIDVDPRHNGGSWYGYTLGTIGLLLIVWLSLLGVRKRTMTRGRWSLKAWTSAHVYLGLALSVIGTLHTGFQLGWNVHTLAWGLMMLVIASGLYGVIVYSTLPTALSNNAREMTRAQMVEALDAIDRQLDSAAQPLERSRADLVIAALNEDVFGAGVAARLTGRYPRCRTTYALENFGIGMTPNETEDRVRSLLGRRKGQLDQIRRAMKIRARLEVWLYLHIPATIALLAALTAHVISVFYYW